MLKNEKPVVLVVDDTTVNRSMFRVLLTRLGYEAIFAENGPAAIRLCEEGRHIDLILMDYMMPLMTGAEAIQGILAIAPYDKTPILGISANSSDETKLEMLQAGAVDFVSRNVDIAELKAKVANHLKMRFLNLEIEEKNRILNNELEQARRVQEQLLPHTWPDLDPVRVFSVYHPSIAVGGDYLDYFRSPDGTFNSLVADVSGHGIHAAMTSAMVKALIETFARYLMPLEVLTDLNEMLVRLLPDEFYVSVCYLSISPDRKEASLITAGHPLPLLLRRGEMRFTAIQQKKPNRFLGFFPHLELVPLGMPCGPGDIFLLYTDGLLDIVNPLKKSHDPEPLIELLAREPAATTPEAVKARLEECIKSVNPELIDDDIAVLAIQVGEE